MSSPLQSCVPHVPAFCSLLWFAPYLVFVLLSFCLLLVGFLFFVFLLSAFLFLATLDSITATSLNLTFDPAIIFGCSPFCLPVDRTFSCCWPFVSPFPFEMLHLWDGGILPWSKAVVTLKFTCCFYFFLKKRITKGFQKSTQNKNKYITKINKSHRESD